MPFCHFTGYNLWLLKPTKLNRGRGIHVVNNLTMLKDLISRYCDGWAKPAQPVAAAKPKKEEEEKPIVFDELMGVVVEEGQ
jgi:hypothetical protein